MPTQPIRLPGSLTGRRKPVDVGHVHWCSEACVDITPLERRIVELVAFGLGNKVIGQQLGLSGSAIKNHLTRIMRRIRVGSRTELAVLAVRIGIIE